MKLHISDSLSLPLEAVTQTFAVLAKRGSGKSYLASVVAEEMLKAGQPIVALDPTGGWWGLRSGFPIAVLGGEHGDIPLQESAGEVIAQAIVDNRFPAVIDLSLFRKGQMIRFMVGFLETLYRLNRDPVHIFVDEADAFAPQGRNFGGDENRMLGAMEDLVRRGRKRGLGCTLITQRPAVLNKNVLTQCESVFALRMVHPRDIAALKEWIDVHADPAQSKEFIESLPSLPVGETWFWSPGWMGTLERLKVRKRETFDSSATPKAGEVAKKPKTLAKLDLEQLGAQIQATVQSAKESDPRELKRRIAELEKQLRERPKETQERIVEKIVEVHVLKNGQLDKALRLRDGLQEIVAPLVEAISRVTNQKPSPAPPRTPIVHSQPVQARQPAVKTQPVQPRPAVQGEPGEIGTGGKRRMLIALAQRPQGMSARQLGVRAGLSSGSGTFGTYLGELRARSWIVGERERLQITDAGVAALGDYDPLPTGQALLGYWLRELGDSGVARMLRALADVYPHALTKDALGEAAGMSAGSGTFGTYLGKLRSLELCEGKSEITAAAELFD